jgi:hypothetical protein
MAELLTPEWLRPGWLSPVTRECTLLVDPLTSGPVGQGYTAQTVATPSRPYPSPENDFMPAAFYPVSL